MRYYNIIIEPLTGLPQVYSTIGLVNPLFGNYSALQVELDIMQAPLDQPQQLGLVKIKGVSYPDISFASNLNGARILISVGMSLGLPLANPLQQGLIINGTVLQAFGNWQGNNVSLDLVVGPSSYADNNQNPANIIWNWVQGQPMQEAIETALLSAYPIVPVYGNISPNLIALQTKTAVYPDLPSFARMIKRVSSSYKILPNYNGVEMVFNSLGILLNDGTPSTPHLALVNYQDLIGNITYITASEIQAKIVMRGDLSINDYIQFPIGSPTAVINVTNPYNFYKNAIPFAGVYQIKQIHHMGNSRQADSNSWVTVLNCYIPEFSSIPLSIQTLISAVGY